MTTLPQYQCRRLEQPLVPSGQLDRPPWTHTDWIDCHLVPGGEALPADRWLRAALRWDVDCLYVAFDSAPSLVPVTMAQRDAALWEECSAEIFLAAGSGYYEIEVNPLGAVLDLHFPDEAEEDWQACARWDAEGLTWAVGPSAEPAARAGGWSAELAIPWVALPELTRQSCDHQACVRAQLCRSQRRADGGYEPAAWGPVRERFCEHSAMGQVMLVEDG